MGYSCTAKAAFVRDAIEAQINKMVPGKASNRLPGGGFWETGREQADGSITGTIWKAAGTLTDAERMAAAVKQGCPNNPEWIGDPVRKGGSFKISADGKIERWPGMPRDWKTLCEIRGAQKYVETFETPRPMFQVI